MSRFSISKRAYFVGLIAAMLFACVGTAGRDFDTTHVAPCPCGL